MTFQVIQRDVPTPQDAIDAVNLLNEKYGYGIPLRPTGAVLTQLEGIDTELEYFFRGFIFRKYITDEFWADGLNVSYVDLELLDFVAKQIQDARKDRNLRHAIANKYFGTLTSEELHRMLAGFRKAFAQMKPDASYTVRVV